MSCFGVTGELRETVQFEWKIPNFSSLMHEKDDFYISPSFKFKDNPLHLMVYPAGNLHASNGYLSMFVVNEIASTLNVTFSFHFKTVDGTLAADQGGDVTLKTDWGYRDFITLSELEQKRDELIPSDNLTIVLVLKDNQGRKQATSQVADVEMKASKSTDYRRITELDDLSENLRDFSSNTDSCDVVLEFEDKEYKAHKTILMARSSVFAAMFKHDTLEKQTGVVKILDCDSESFQEFLDYLYSGKLQGVSYRSAFQLFITSCKYDVQKLKDFCMQYLAECLTTDNVCDVFQLADKYQEAKLITKAQHFFNENWSRIFVTTEWASLLTNNADLANKILVEFSKTKDSQ